MYFLKKLRGIKALPLIFFYTSYVAQKSLNWQTLVLARIEFVMSNFLSSLLLRDTFFLHKRK
jgi:hypothetical protein